MLLLAEPMLMFVLGQSGTAPPAGPPSDSTGAALYAVVTVIAVFIVAIVTLSIIIVLLYRRKCGHQDLSTASGEDPVHGVCSLHLHMPPVELSLQFLTVSPFCRSRQ